MRVQQVILQGFALAFAGAMMGTANAQIPPTPPNLPADVAGIPVNYDETKVGTYTLPLHL